jgi:hypothetical protein
MPGMKNLALLAELLTDSPHPNYSDAVDRAYVLAELTPWEAARLEGRRARFLAEPDSLPEFVGRSTAFDVTAPEGLHASVFLFGCHDELPGTMIVEATLAIVEQPAWVAPDGTRFDGFTEWRLLDARR